MNPLLLKLFAFLLISHDPNIHCVEVGNPIQTRLVCLLPGDLEDLPADAEPPDELKPLLTPAPKAPTPDGPDAGAAPSPQPPADPSPQPPADPSSKHHAAPPPQPEHDPHDGFVHIAW
jgi:hypothetical protein